MSKIIGIDFGTTNSVATFMNSRGKIEIIKDHNGDYLMPSIIAMYNNKKVFGKNAKENVQAFVNGDGIKEVKREIGKGKKLFFGGKDVEVSDVVGLILNKIKGNAEEYFKEEITEAVITIPAEFSDGQRKEIIEAASKAGLEVKKIINEPTAALLAYTLNNPTNKKVLCYDFGGGTFDVSIANVSQSGIEVIAVGGDRELGGKDIDAKFLQYFKDDLRRKGLTLNSYGEYQLLLEVEKAKIKLSTSEIARISILALSTTSRTTTYDKSITRTEFNRLINSIVIKTKNIIIDTLSEKRLQPSDIDEVILVGGSSKMPLVRREIEGIFGSKVKESKNIDTCVAMGAAIEAANQMGTLNQARARIKRDVCPFNLGLKVYRDNSEDVFDPIVFKNSPYGVEFSQEYNTAFDRQTTMELEIYQGESEWASKNEHITDFEITGIPASSAGEEWVKITFKYDENGIISIKARVLSTGLEKVHQYKYGYDINKKVDRSVIDKHMIDSDLRIEAVKTIEMLENKGLSRIAGTMKEHLKYEQEDELEDLLARHKN